MNLSCLTDYYNSVYEQNTVKDAAMDCFHKSSISIFHILHSLFYLSSFSSTFRSLPLIDFYSL